MTPILPPILTDLATFALNPPPIFRRFPISSLSPLLEDLCEPINMKIEDLASLSIFSCALEAAKGRDNAPARSKIFARFFILIQKVKKASYINIVVMEKMIVMKIKDIRYHVVLLLFLISLISSIMLSVTPVSVICDVSSGCEVVHYSQYNYTFGMQNSYYGVVIFTLLILLTLSHLINPSQNKKALINLSIVGGSLMA